MTIFHTVADLKDFITNRNITTLRVYQNDSVDLDEPYYVGSYLAYYPENKLILDDHQTLHLTLYKSVFKGRTLEPFPYTLTNSTLFKYIFFDMAEK